MLLPIRAVSAVFSLLIIPTNATKSVKAPITPDFEGFSRCLVKTAPESLNYIGSATEFRVRMKVSYVFAGPP